MLHITQCHVKQGSMEEPGQYRLANMLNAHWYMNLKNTIPKNLEVNAIKDN